MLTDGFGGVHLPEYPEPCIRCFKLDDEPEIFNPCHARIYRVQSVGWARMLRGAGQPGSGESSSTVGGKMSCLISVSCLSITRYKAAAASTNP